MANMKIFLDNPDGLIGDFLGTIPVMQELAKDNELYVKIHPEAEGLFKLIETDNLKRVENDEGDYDKKLALDISAAFDISVKNNYYMSQAHFAYFGMDIPIIPPKAKLSFKRYDSPVGKPYYVISPFARSLSEDQKWQQEKWQDIVDINSEIEFVVFGSALYNPLGYINGLNVTPLYDYPFETVCNILLDSKGIISLVTGTSHLAFHLGVKNILLTNQNMSWGINPDAIKITQFIPDIKPETIQKLISGEHINNR